MCRIITFVIFTEKKTLLYTPSYVRLVRVHGVLIIHILTVHSETIPRMEPENSVDGSVPTPKKIKGVVDVIRGSCQGGRKVN